MKTRIVFLVLTLSTVLLASAWGATEREGKNVRKLATCPDVSATAAAGSQERPLSESPWAKWSFYSDDKNAKATWLPNGGPDKKGCVHIVSENNKSWSFASPAYPLESKYQVLHSEAFAAAAEGFVNHAINVQREKGASSSRSSGGIVSIETNDFVRLWACADAKDGKTYRLSFGGREKTDVYLAPADVYAGEPFGKDDFGPLNGSAKSYLPEKLDRGALALPVENGVYLSWRLLKDDPKGIAFNVCRKGESDSEFTKLNHSPITKTTDFLDTTAKKDSSYVWKICVVGNDKAGDAEVSVAG
ncbi:MAG: hypothetical protein PHQ75_11500, partial [Thermoguttaceae bacterium]|nr:hypothetical protein [Thermoguttaceae bacterium]